VRVSDVGAARAAQDQGAKALGVERAIDGIRSSTSLPLLWLGRGDPVDVDAVAIRPDQSHSDGIENVIDVHDEDELEEALEELDPEIFLISPGTGDDDNDPLESALELLPDVPAGKLAIAQVDVTSREEVVALERAGFDAVLVPAGDIGGLVGHGPLDV
jgi:hypothetical protein